jgi:type I restriction enzyme S subunit
MKQKEKSSLKQMVPTLRFPEFADAGDWEERKLGEIGEVVSGLTYSPDDVNEKGVLVLRSSNIQDGVLSFEDNVFVKTNSYNAVKENDILICVRNGSRNLIGKNALIKKESEGMAFGAFMSIYRSNYNLFLYQWFSSDFFFNQVKKNLGATINSINGNDLKKYKVIFPSLPEQQKIADCLSSLDEVIQLETKKWESLKSYKKGLLQKLFPAEGETVPELRFPEFEGTGDWEDRKLGDFITERNDRPGVNIKLYSLTIENGVTAKTERYERAFLVKNEKEAYKAVFPSDFVLNPMNLRFGAIGKNNSGNQVSISKYYNVFYCDTSVNLNFVEIYLKSDPLINIYDDIATGTLIEKRRVHFVNFLKISISFPSLPEQQKIADCLNSVDGLIQEQAERVEKLKSHKKGLLQGLFPVIGE